MCKENKCCCEMIAKFVLFMELITFLLIVAVLFIVSKPAFAETKPLPTYLVIVRHPQATTAKQLTLAKVAFRKMFEMAKVEQVIKKVTITKDICNANSEEDYGGKALYCWSKLAHRKGWCVHGKRCHILKPPVQIKGLDFGGGVAIGACTIHQYEDSSYAIVREKNLKDEPRIGFSLTAILHENGHNNGADHDESDEKFIMNPNAGKYGEVPLKFSRFSLETIDICLLEEGLRDVSLFKFRIPAPTPGYTRVRDERR